MIKSHLTAAEAQAIAAIVLACLGGAAVVILISALARCAA